MPYPDQFAALANKVTTVGSVRIVDISDRLKTKPGVTHQTRSPWAIRNIVVHYHAGNPHGTSEFAAAGADAGIPIWCMNTAEYAIKDKTKKVKVDGVLVDKVVPGSPGYAYHYDIGYKPHTDGGLDIAFQTQVETNNSWHTGHGQNEMGISISHMGGMREFWNPEGQYGTHDKENPGDPKGRPSAFQRRVFPVILKHLQDKHEISNLHVGGHFQHMKPACPGWDLEYWIMRHEDKPRNEGKGFCWPINPAGSNQAAFIPNDAAKMIPDAKKLVANNLQGGSGLFPISRRFTWHDGAHLFGKEGQAVHAVHDGWVVAGRVNKAYKDDAGNDFGSANFVLILHKDPGLADLLDARTYSGDYVPEPIQWFSLYMHLAPLDREFPWLKRLSDRDMARFVKLTTDGGGTKALNLSGVAIPVKAGEIIGVIGKHNPFASRPAGTKVKDEKPFEASKHAVLHFEVFSEGNMIARFHPDPELHKSWTITDPNANVFADDFLKGLDALTGISDPDIAALKAAADAADADDPQQQDVSAWTSRVTPALNNVLSQVVCKHVSEWKADHDSVIDKRAKAWGLDAAGVKAVKKMVGAFKWWDEVYKTDGTYYAKPTMLPADGVSHHYHPIRMLCWLAGLRRVLDHMPTGGEDKDGFPVSTNIYADMPLLSLQTPRAAAAAGTKELRVSNTVSEERLKGSSIRFAGHHTVYRIESHEKVMNKSAFVEWKVTLRTTLDKAVDKTTKFKLGNYGWHFENDFDWNTPLG